MATNSSDSIALLIDADNAPAAKIEFIIAELATYGVVNIRRAYGNWEKGGLGGWKKVLHEYAIQPVQVFDLVKGKNATDMELAIDAMDILYTKEVGTFCLVTSDCDFAPLALRLRAEGRRVVGFGAQKTPEPFVNSCTHFLYLDEQAKQRGAGSRSKLERGNELKRNTKLLKTLRDAVRAKGDDDGWALMGPVGSHISNQGPFDHRTYGFAKLSDLFSAIDLFEVEKTKAGGADVVRVRIKGNGK